MKQSNTSALVAARSGRTRQKTAPLTCKVSGRVLCFDESFPLEGVTVTDRLTGTDTLTKADGSWEMEILTGRNTLDFQIPGYESQWVTISRSLPFQVVLKKAFNPMSALVFSTISRHSLNR